MGNDAAIRADGLIKNFGETKALAGLSLSVPRGSVFGLLGPNGAGKTTAVRVLTTLLIPDAGRAWVLGSDVVREAGEVRERIGVGGPVAAGIGHALVDARLEEVLADVVVGLHVGVAAAEHVAQVDAGQFQQARRIASDELFGIRARQRHEQALERAVHDLELLRDVRFGEAQVAFGEDGVEDSGIVDADHGPFGPRSEAILAVVAEKHERLVLDRRTDDGEKGLLVPRNAVAYDGSV